MEPKHYRRIRQKALAEANIGVEPKPSRAKPILFGVGAFALVLIVWGFIDWVMPDPDRAADHVKGSSDSDEVIDIGLGSTEVEELAASFLQAESVEELLEIIEHPEISEPRLRAFYGENGPGKLPMGGVFLEIREIEFGDDETLFGVMVNNVFGSMVLLPVREGTQGQPTIEWEASVGWMDPSWEEIIEAKPVDPTVVKVFVTPDDYYNYEYRDEQKWVCVKLSSRDLESDCYAYFERGDEEMAGLASLKTTAPVVLEIKFRPGQTRAMAEVVRLRNFSWIEE